MSRVSYNDAAQALDRADMHLSHRQPQEALANAMLASTVDLGPQSNLCAIYYAVLALRELYRLDEALKLCEEMERRVLAFSTMQQYDNTTKSLLDSCCSAGNDVKWLHQVQQLIAPAEQNTTSLPIFEACVKHILAVFTPRNYSSDTKFVRLGLALQTEYLRRKFVNDPNKDMTKIKRLFEDKKFLPTRQYLQEAFHCTLPDPKEYNKNRSFPDRLHPDVFLQLLQEKKVDVGEALDYLLGTDLPYSSYMFFFQKKNLYADPTFNYVSVIQLYDSGGAFASYEVITQEFVTAFATYLKKRCDVLNITITPIVELGAGDGRLTFHLNQTKIVPVSILPTDAYPPTPSNFPVEVLDHTAAVKKYHPQLVFSCWMSYGDDWTEFWRKDFCNLAEYILIGEVENCGKSWETYGRNPPAPHLLPPYFVGGFEMVEVDEVSAYQLTGFSGQGTQKFFGFIFSQTLSFRRTQVCGNCKKPLEGTVKHCGQCFVVPYCSRQCQTQHWPYHKEYCRPNFLRKS